MSESRPIITYEDAEAARACLMAIVRGEFDPDDRGINQRCMAADALLRFFLAQERYGLVHVNEAASRHNAGRDVIDLAAMSDEELNAYRAKIIDYPRKDKALPS